MAFFNSAVQVLQTLVVALGAGIPHTHDPLRLMWPQSQGADPKNLEGQPPRIPANATPTD